MNYTWEIYKILASRGCEQIIMEFDSEYRILASKACELMTMKDDKVCDILVVKYKRKNQITNEMTDEMFTIVPKNYKTEKDLKAKVIRELYCI
jgi:hypothetical protein